MRAARTTRACALLLVVCVTAAFGIGARTGVAHAAEPSGSIQWQSCEGSFECGTLTVPLDPTAPTGPTIDLAVIRKPARAPRHRIGSLVFNPGGPGAPAVSFLTSEAATLPAALRDRFDLVAFDPRGVGRSSPIECEDSLDPLFDKSFQPPTSEARAALVDGVTSLAHACAVRNGDLLAHVSTADTVQDLEQLRVALGDDRLSFVGYSYGTVLGADYADAYPDRVRAFVLDGPIDSTMTATEVTLGQARGFERALDDFLADCSAHRACAFRHDGDAAAAYDALRARAARSPLRADDIAGRRLNETRFDAAVLDLLYLGRSGWSELGDALAAADHGDASRLLALADEFVGRDGEGREDHVLDAFWAVTCLDGPVVGDVAAATALEARAVAVAPRIGAFIVNNSLPCSVWPVPAQPTRGRPTASGAPPILVVGTTRDPATPLAQGRALARQLDRGRLLVVAGDQHTAFNQGNTCVDDAVTRYLVERRVPRPGTRC